MIGNRLFPENLRSLVTLFPDKYLVINPLSYTRICENCGGWGRVAVYHLIDGPHISPTGKRGSKYIELDGKSGWYNGELMVGFCPVCSGNKRQEWLDGICGLTGKDKDVFIHDFDVKEKRIGKKPARDLIARLLSEGKSASGMVMFYGGYGVGKSMLLKAAVNGFRLQGITAHYSSMTDILADIRSNFGDDKSSRLAESALEEYRRYHVLAIDELDRINMTGWAMETVFRLIDDRYKSNRELLTIAVTNTSPKDLSTEYGYITSRMSEGWIIEVPGPDMREIVGEIVRERKDIDL